MAAESSSIVPEELMRQFHQANEHFQHCREQLEQSMDGSEFRHQERVEAATNELRQAEGELERVEGQIREVLVSHAPRSPASPLDRTAPDAGQEGESRTGR